MTADHPVRPWVVTDPCTCTKPGRAPDLSPAEAARVAEFDAAPPAPESFDAIAAIRRVLALADAMDSLADEFTAEGNELSGQGWPDSARVNWDAADDQRATARRIRAALDAS